MESFTKLFGSLLVFVYHCFDRIVINGYLENLSRPDQGFPERRSKWQISAEGGFRPQWRADGKELYWLANDFRNGMVATVELLGGGAGEVVQNESDCTFSVLG